jgi:hypothetical protein
METFKLLLEVRWALRDGSLVTLGQLADDLQVDEQEILSLVESLNRTGDVVELVGDSVRLVETSRHMVSVGREERDVLLALLPKVLKTLGSRAKARGHIAELIKKLQQSVGRIDQDSIMGLMPRR